MTRAHSVALATFAIFLSSAAIATASCDDQSVGWDCGGFARATCNSPYGNHSWSVAQAANSVDPYRKCAVLRNSVSNFTYDRQCYSAYLVTASIGSNCTNPDVIAGAGNDTDQSHGLRGEGNY